MSGIRMMGVLFTVEKEQVCDRGAYWALSCVTARSHILLSTATLSICWFMKGVVCPRYLGVNSLHPF